MKIKGKLNCDVDAFLIKSNQSHDDREAFVDLSASIKQDEAAARFGEDFATMAFSTMRVMAADGPEDTDAIAFLVDKVTPGKRVVFEQHSVTFGDNTEVMAQPELRGIKTVDGEARVVAQLRIPIEVGKKSLLNSLIGEVGQTVKVGFDPVQAALDFSGAAAKAKSKGEPVEMDEVSA